MTPKICTLLIAFIALFTAIGLTGCERVKASETAAVSETNENSTVGLPSIAQISPDQKLSVRDVSETALLSNRAIQVAEMRASIRPEYYFRRYGYTSEELGYHYAYHRDIARPPAFSGLGHEHFARADV